MKLKTSTLGTVILSIFFLFISCRSAQKNFEKGNYEKAYDGLVREMEKGSKNRKDRTLLNKSFEEMLSQYFTETELLLRKPDITDWERAFQLGDDLIEDYIKGRRWLDTDFEDSMQNLTAEQDSLALDIADAYMEQGDQLMDRYHAYGDKELAREAYTSYVKVELYAGSDPLLAKLIENSLREATVEILFVSDVWDFNLSWVVDREFRRLENETGKFRNVHYGNFFEEPDCLVEFNFSRLDKDQTEERQTDNYTKEIIVRYEMVKDSSGNSVQKPVYETVKAKVVTTIARKNYLWQMRAKVDFNLNYCGYDPRSFNAQRTYEAVSYATTGDERALPENMKNLTNESFNLNEEKVIEELVTELYAQVRNYYF